MTASPPRCASCTWFKPATGPILDPRTGHKVVLGDCTRANAPLGAGVRSDTDHCSAHSAPAR